MASSSNAIECCLSTVPSPPGRAVRLRLNSSFQLLRAVGGLQSRDHVPQVVAQKHPVVGGVEADAVIGHAVLRPVVGADLLGAVAGAIWARRSAPSAACCSASIFS